MSVNIWNAEKQDVEKLAGDVNINDGEVSEESTWSSEKINKSLMDKAETVSFFTIDEFKDFLREHHESKVYLFKTPVGAGYLSGFITQGRTNASTAGIMSIKGNDADGWFADFHIYDGYLNAFVSRYSESDDKITKCNELQNGKYSTDEQVVGEWIDGKPIYRKVLSYTTAGLKDISQLNADTVVNFSFKSIDKGAIFFNGSVPTSTNTIKSNAYINNAKTQLSLEFEHTNYTLVKFEIIVEYTKTTD